jgi:orotidine-5'-phosphate decarboxylase
MEAIGPHLNGRKVIYDHQKGGTDIPDLEDALPTLLDAGVHAVILFPFGGRVTQERWTKSAADAGLTVLVGGQMTQPGFLWSAGGYIHDDAPELMYRRAVQQGVRDFVVPGNQPEAVGKYFGIIEDEIGKQDVPGDPPVLFAPGFVRQGGVITDTGAVAGERWHAIAASALVKATDVEAAARELTSQLG